MADKRAQAHQLLYELSKTLDDPQLTEADETYEVGDREVVNRAARLLASHEGRSVLIAYESRPPLDAPNLCLTVFDKKIQLGWRIGRNGPLSFLGRLFGRHTSFEMAGLDQLHVSRAGKGKSLAQRLAGDSAVMSALQSIDLKRLVALYPDDGIGLAVRFPPRVVTSVKSDWLADQLVGACRVLEAVNGLRGPPRPGS